MARQVNQLLHLAEASEAQNYVFEPVDVGALVEDVSDYLRRLADRQRVDRGAQFTLFSVRPRTLTRAWSACPDGA